MTTMTVLLILLALLLIKIRDYSCSINDINDAKLGHSLLQNGWVMCPVGVDSSHSSCLNATIPGTVLTNLLKHQFFGFQESEIYFKDNIRKVPDVVSIGRDFYTRTFFVEIKDNILKLGPFDRIFLLFRGINYRAKISLCDVHLSDISEKSGMFATRRYDISSIIRSRQCSDQQMKMAVHVCPPDFVGSVDGGQGGDHEIARNAGIMQSVAGWDWIQGTPDRNTGIWDEVSLLASGSVAITQPYLRTVAVDATQKTAQLVGEMHVSSADKTTALLFMRLELSTGKFICSVATINLEIGQEILVSLPALELQQARLWWPHPLGPPNLYPVEMGAIICDSSIPANDSCLDDLQQLLHSYATPINENFRRRDLPSRCSCTLSDVVALNVGIRTVESYIDQKTEGRAFRINGQRLFLTGGNWIASDQLLRLSRERYVAELEMHKHMGLAMVRVWGGGITGLMQNNDILVLLSDETIIFYIERPDFYAACDVLGLLVYQEFWMTGDNNGRWAGSYDWPDDHSAYLENARDAVLMLRNHPSLILWAAGNELYPRESNPPPDILAGLQSMLQSLDPDSEFIASSMAPQSSDCSLFDPEYALAPQDGPYGILLPSQWYEERNPGLSAGGYSTCPISFQPETGSVSTPVMRSLKRFLPTDSLLKFPSKLSENVDELWDYHKYIPYTSILATKEPYDHIYSYGAPLNVSEYAIRAQMVQFEQYRALFEGFRLHQWTFYSAVLMWKSQSPWPSLRGALYDYYLATTGGYYGTRAALSNDIYYGTELQLQNFVGKDFSSWTHPRFVTGLHAQLNPASLMVSVVNSLPCNFTQMSITIRATAVALNGSILSFRDFHIFGLQESEVFTFTEGLPIPNLPTSAVYIYRIDLLANAVIDQLSSFNQGEALCSTAQTFLDKPYVMQRNSYILSMNTTAPDYFVLGEMRSNRNMFIKLLAVHAVCRSSNSSVLAANGHRRREIDLYFRNGPNNGVALGLTATLLTTPDTEVDFEGSPSEDHRVLPSFYSDGQITLMADEEAVVHIEFGDINDPSQQLYVSLEGWNIETAVISIVC